MRISINITNYSWPHHNNGLAGQLTRIATAAEQAGLDTVWVCDHLIQVAPDSTPVAEMLEAYTTLGYLAAQTRRVRIGTMVTAASLRPAALLIKAVTTVDVLSSGRAWLGIGAGYHEAEAEAMGLPLPTVTERYERLEETLQLASRMWSGDDSPVEGKHLRLKRPLNIPGPVHQPRPPILIGGMGEHKTLRLVAQYADACNLFDVPDNGRTITRKLRVLAQHCENLGRPYSEVEEDRQHAPDRRRIGRRVHTTMRGSRRTRHRPRRRRRLRSLDRGLHRDPRCLSARCRAARQPLITQ
jgi:F420-dependent oxidoreductase-like protein